MRRKEPDKGKAKRYSPDEKREHVREIYQLVYVNREMGIKEAATHRGITNQSFYDWDADPRLWGGEHIHPSQEFGVPRVSRRRRPASVTAGAMAELDAAGENELAGAYVAMFEACRDLPREQLQRTFLAMRPAWPMLHELFGKLLNSRFSGFVV